MSKRLERNIVLRQNYKTGDVYYFINAERKYEPYSSLKEAQTARRYADWEKSKWTWTGLGNRKNVIKEGVNYDPAVGKYYAFLHLVDDILVSQPYGERKKAVRIQKYLHEHNWSVTALNNELHDGIGVTFKYHHILPTKKGYIVMDDCKKSYGCYDTLEEAYQRKEELMNKGEL